MIYIAIAEAVAPLRFMRRTRGCPVLTALRCCWLMKGRPVQAVKSIRVSSPMQNDPVPVFGNNEQIARSAVTSLLALSALQQIASGVSNPRRLAAELLKQVGVK